ncbi:MAG: DUF5723 family protein [Bacteroidales bacterium]
MFRKTTRLSFILLFFAILVRAQNSQVMYYMNLPQNHLFNPALIPSNSFYFGLGITGIGIGEQNNFFNLSDILIPGSSDSLITFLHPDYDIENFFKKLKRSNFIIPEADIQLFGLGFNTGKNTYVFLDLIERVNGNISLPGELIRLGLNGNEDFVGKTLNLNNLNAGVIYFREAGAGFSTIIREKLRLGVRAKIMFGIGCVSLDNRFLSLTVNDDFTHTFNADLMVNMSGPANVYFDADNNPDSIVIDEDKLESPDFYLNTRNAGMGIDIGAVYNITDRFSISAALTEIGYIKWKDMITNMKAESQFVFSGFNVKDVVNGTKTFEELTDEMLDSLKNSLVITDDKKPFTTFLTPCVTFGARYDITKSFGLALLSRTYIKEKELKEAVTLSANLNIGNSFSTSLTYTANRYTYDNFGAGLALRMGFLQFYILTDKIPVMWNRIITNGTTIPLPASWNMLNVRFGFNIALGNKARKKSDRPMLKVE